MSLAFLFPGQGSEAPRMGLDLAAHFPAARALLELAGRLARVDLLEVLARGGAAFSRTEVLQPALVAVSLGAALALAQAGVRVAVVAGHSLGELTAWAAAGGAEPEAAVELAARRGALMAREAARRPGGMLLLAGDDAPVLDEPGVVLAGRNAPRDWVVAGPTAALQRMRARRRGTPVAVSGAWHSPAMAGAVDELRATMLSLPPRRPWGRICGAGDAEALAAQLVSPFDFPAQLAATAGATFVTVGPGRVLRGLVRKTLGPAARVLGTEDLADLRATIAELRS